MVSRLTQGIFRRPIRSIYPFALGPTFLICSLREFSPIRLAFSDDFTTESLETFYCCFPKGLVRACNPGRSPLPTILQFSDFFSLPQKKYDDHDEAKNPVVSPETVFVAFERIPFPLSLSSPGQSLMLNSPTVSSCLSPLSPPP